MTRTGKPARQRLALCINIFATLILTLALGQSREATAQSQWETNGTNINSTNTGNVGIGTTSPGAKLDVAGNTTTTNTAQFGNFGVQSIGNTNGLLGQNLYYDGSSIKYRQAGAISMFQFNDGDINFGNAASGSAGANATVTNSVIFKQGAPANSFYLSSTGNIGVGTTDLTDLLVAGNDKLKIVDGPMTLSFRDFSSGQGYLAVGSTNGIKGFIGHTNVNDGFTIGSFSNHKLTIRTNSVNRLTIDTSGNVGIGTTSPLEKLQIATSTNGQFATRIDSDATAGNSYGLLVRAGTNSSDAALRVRNSGGTADYFYVRGNGDVGIGTTNPLDKLHVYGVDPALRFETPLNTVKLKYVTSGGGAAERLGFWGGGGTELVSFMNNGNVGIGTTSPTAKLEVNGAAKITGNLDATGTITGGTIEAKYQDVAEWVPASHALPAGTVVTLDTAHTNQVTASSTAYDTRVAGVISEKPGLALGEAGKNKVLVATTGRVKVKVDATRSPIHIGDLLVTSDVAGIAMKSEPVELGGVKLHRPGTLIGKALEPLEKGTGEILVLLSLQ